MQQSMMQNGGMARMRPPNWLRKCMRDYKIYATRSVLAASAVQQNVSLAFDHTGYIFAISAVATMVTTTSNAVITPAIGCRDAFTILLKKASNVDVLVTNQVAASSLFGLYTGPLELVRPWPISRSQSIIAVCDNLSAATAITIELCYHLAITAIGTDQ